MKNQKNLNALTKDELIELIGIYSKNWLAMDGVWFQSVERKFGMDEAMFHDMQAWKRFTVIEARRGFLLCAGVAPKQFWCVAFLHRCRCSPARARSLKS